MIRDEFLMIARRALRTHRGSDSVTAGAVRPSPIGPLVEWEGPLLARERQRRLLPGGGHVLGAPSGPDLLAVLVRFQACRWRHGPPHAPLTWADDLAARQPRIFQHPPCSHAGWSWLWQAGAELITEHGVPKGFRTVDTKEKFGSLRWYTEAKVDDTYADNVIGCIDHISNFVCEYCGAPGLLRKGSWVKCMCEAHAQGRKPFRAEEA
ncbi:hypothetical protein [Methylobacterium sp. AMS5]|uniref:hypothetical protein n=1 Tax=Methylobacterium sp. AMS5 TaxID=925818 RepID=UPI00074FA699|nr:hypothetical protein [Methylobacterium sp. AMS5]AMB45053.1 hypothetical protein Y590_09105 [Methylobacterium sp. AMS5]